jgi:hypothetical protein
LLPLKESILTSLNEEKETEMSDQIKHDDFTVNKDNLYREVSITDLHIATIKILTPIKADLTDDESRSTRYFGETQMMSPEGPVPVRAIIPALSAEEAVEGFPAAMEKALADLVERVKNMQKDRQKKKSKSIPGR